MNKREKMLTAAVALLVLLWGGTAGLDRYRAKLDANSALETTAVQSLSAARAEYQRGQRARRKLHDWNRQSLPADVDVAKSLYQDWLQQQLSAAGLQARIDDRPRRAASSDYRQLTFVVGAEGKIEQLVEFLYKFYAADYLHRISAATLTKSGESDALTISLTIDALALDSSRQTDALAPPAEAELASTLDEYRKTILSRNIFTAWKPAASAGAEKPGVAGGQADKARVTGMTYGQGGWLMSIRLEDADKILRFREGDSIEIGAVQGTVAELDGRRAIVEMADQKLLVKIGQYLGEATPVGDGAGI